jgi:hypothetical protein
MNDGLEFDDMEDAVEFLSNSLSAQEIERCIEVRYEISRHIRWKTVTALWYRAMLGSMENLMDGNKEELLKGKGSILDNLTPSEREFLLDGDKGPLRSRYIIHQLVRKLLGALKTHTKKEHNNIPVVTTIDGILAQEAAGTSVDADEEEMNLVLGQNFESEEDFPTDVGGVLQPSGLQEEQLEMNFEELEEDATIVANLRREKQCPHHRVRIQEHRVGERHFLEEVCRDCSKLLRRRLLRPREKEEGPCTHSKALWTPGKEGQEAFCPKCKMIHENPGKFSWQDVGLEPLGDDPTKDELMSLDEVATL